MERKLGSVSVDRENKIVNMRLPRLDADRNIHFVERSIAVDEWLTATRERLQILPKVIEHLHNTLQNNRIQKYEYSLYLYGSLARGQCRGTIDNPWINSSDIDIAICDSNNKIGSKLSPKLNTALGKLKFENITDILVSVGEPPDHFDLLHSIKLNNTKSQEIISNLSDVSIYFGDYDKLSEKLLPLSVVKEFRQSALAEIWRVEIDKSYNDNVQRILDKLKYDKIESFKDSLKVTKCVDGYVINCNNNIEIIDDTGMCYELALRAGFLLQVMYPDNQYLLAEDPKRPSGWNHFFILDIKNNLIIDPSKNMIGKLEETGQWDDSGVNYNLDNKYNLDNEIQQSKKQNTNVSVKVKEDKSSSTVRYPLISPRHFEKNSNITPFGISLMFNTDYNLPILYMVSTDCEYGIVLEPNIEPQRIQQDFKSKNIFVPLDVIKRIVDMFESILSNGNFVTSELTVDDFNKGVT